MRTRRAGAFAILSGCIFISAAAHADSDGGGFVVIPGRPDVPVIVNPYGFDASYTVIEMEFGLNKPAQNNTQIIVGPPGEAGSGFEAPRRFYFPHAENAPAYGRLEAPPRPGGRVTQTPQSYNRSWGAASDPLPASTDPPYPISVSPWIGGGGGPWGPRDRWRRHGGGRR